MKAEIINKILAATTSVLTDYFNISLESGGDPEVVSAPGSLAPVTVILGITGDLEGQFILGYEAETALNVARSMLGNPEYAEFDEMAKSALSELGNMIGGMTSTGLSDLGYLCNLSPPSLLTSQSGTISMSASTMISLPLQSSAGDFFVCIGLRDSNN